MRLELILVRGLPGSGKTTMAGIIAESGRFVHFEADQFFVDNAGMYRWDKARIADAHAWCREKVYVALGNGQNVIVSNTFVTYNEMKPYIEMADYFHARLYVIEMRRRGKSEHNIPTHIIKRMQDKWEYLSGDW